MRNLLFAVFLVGCGGSLTELEGIYNVTAWTENTAGCGAEGASVLETMSDKAIYVEEDEFFGEKFVAAVHCTDEADCRAKAGMDTLFLDGFFFESGGDDDGWKGQTVFASGTDMCSGQVIDHAMSGDVGTSIRIESRTRESRPFAKDSEGFCDTDDAREAAEGQPCTELEVLSATFTADL
jgi:hypothetical protein